MITINAPAIDPRALRFEIATGIAVIIGTGSGYALSLLGVPTPMGWVM